MYDKIPKVQSNSTLTVDIKTRECEITDLEHPHNPFKLLKYKYICVLPFLK